MCWRDMVHMEKDEVVYCGSFSWNFLVAKYSYSRTPCRDEETHKVCSTQGGPPRSSAEVSQIAVKSKKWSVVPVEDRCCLLGLL